MDDDEQEDDNSVGSAPSGIDNEAEEASDDSSESDASEAAEAVVESETATLDQHAEEAAVDGSHLSANDNDNDPESSKPRVTAPVLRTFSRKSRVVDDEDNHNTLDSSHDDDKSSAVDRHDDDLVDSDQEDENDSDNDVKAEDGDRQELAANEVVKAKKPPKIKNSLYRMQLLEEERRHRAEKVENIASSKQTCLLMD
jgi:hypothetical protein